MSAIAPPPIPGVSDEAIETRREAAEALTSLQHDHELTGTGSIARTSPMRGFLPRGWLGSFAGLGMFGAVSVVVAVGGRRVMGKRLGLAWPVLCSLGALAAWSIAKMPPRRARLTAGVPEENRG